MKRLQKMAIFSFLMGIVITLVSGAFLNPFWIGASSWGYLLPWLVQVITWAPQPKTVIWENLVIDIAVWSVISFAVLKFIRMISSS